MINHTNAKDDIKLLYSILEQSFPEDNFKVYRTGSRKQTLSIDSVNSKTEDVVKCLRKNEKSLKKYAIFSRIWKVNGFYFKDLTFINLK